MTMTTTPAAPSLAFGEDTGTSDADGVINPSGPLLIGQTVPNATITRYDNAVAAGATNTVATGEAPSLYSAPLYRPPRSVAVLS